MELDGSDDQLLGFIELNGLDLYDNVGKQYSKALGILDWST
jgi:hypothetical protein